eukprot:m.199763 g.199763  ORF g.199763 m.199763 type:complete len:129 (+) comp39574_c0_seq2:133-519(+)
MLKSSTTHLDIGCASIEIHIWNFWIIVCIFSIGMVVNHEIMDIVCNYVDDKRVLAFGRQLLKKNSTGVKNVIAGNDSPYEKVYAILEAWYEKEGKGATVEKLISVCAHPCIGIDGAVKTDLTKAGHWK